MTPSCYGSVRPIAHRFAPWPPGRRTGRRSARITRGRDPGGKPIGSLTRGTSVVTYATEAVPAPAVAPDLVAAVTGRGDRGWDADAILEQLYASHWRRLVRLAVLLVRDSATAEEVVQDAFVACHRRWRTLHDPENAAAYLRRAVVNGARSVLRHRGVVARHEARELGRGPEVAPGADEPALAGERRAQILDALAALPRRQREVIVLRYYLDLSEAEIASTLSISRGAVKSHASRGAAALRRTLTDQLEEL